MNMPLLRQSARQSARVYRISVPCGLLGAILALSPSLHCQILITRWDFNAASLTPETGAGEARLVGGTTGTFAAGHDGEASGAWNLKGFPSQGTLPGTAGVEFALSTEGHGSIALSFQVRHSNTSANTERVLWSSNGTLFHEATRFSVTPAPTGSGETWYSRSLQLPSEAGQQPWLQVRIVSDFADIADGQYTATRLGSSYSTAGTWRFDNVSFSAVPEPEEYATVGAVGLMGFALWRKRRRTPPKGTPFPPDSPKE